MQKLSFEFWEVYFIYKIMTTRQTDGLHQGYKPKLPASA